MSIACHSPANGRGAPPRRRRGSVLLMVLVMIVLLSGLIVQFTAKGMTEIAVEAHYADRDRLKLVAYSALETTLAVIADVLAIEGQLTAPAQGWADPLAIAGFALEPEMSVAVTFTDESGKLPLGELDEGSLFLMFTEMGFPSEDALKLTQSLLDWIDTDDETRIDGAESDIYAEAEWPYQANNRPMQRLSELAIVDGFRTLFFDEHGRPNGYYHTFAATVSPYADGNLNANSVSDLALRSYAGFGDLQIAGLRDYQAGADRQPGTADDRYFASNEEITRVLGELPEGVRLAVGITVLRIRVTVEFGGGHYAIEAVVQPGQGSTGGPGTPVGGPGGSPTGPARSATGAASTQITYPFVFLELTEDVGQNASIAAPLEAETPPTGGYAGR